MKDRSRAVLPPVGTAITIAVSVWLAPAPGTAAAADDIPISNVIGGHKMVCTPKNCKYELRCDTASPNGCLYSNLGLGLRHGSVLTKYEYGESPYSGALESGQSVNLKLKTSAFGRKEIKRYLSRGKRKLSGGWDLQRPEVLFPSEQEKATLLARGTGWYERHENCRCLMGQSSHEFQNVVIRLKT